MWSASPDDVLLHEVMRSMVSTARIVLPLPFERDERRLPDHREARIVAPLLAVWVLELLQEISVGSSVSSPSCISS